MNNQPRPNTPSFTTLVKYPKTQSEIRDLIDSKEFSLETPLFLALVPRYYGGIKNKWNLFPAIVYNAEQGMYRVGNRTCGQYEKADDYFAFHAVSLEFTDNEIDFAPSYIFVSEKFTGGQEHISELFYPLPIEMYGLIMDVLPAVMHSEVELDRVKEVWGGTKNNAMYYAWYALQARKELIRNTLDCEAEQGKWQDPRFSVNWIDPVDTSSGDAPNAPAGMQIIPMSPDRSHVVPMLPYQGIETIGDAKRAVGAGIIQSNK